MDDLTIIVVSWNCRGHLIDCLRSIENSGSSCKLSVIVVDNDSSDGTVETLRRDFPAVRVLANTRNIGFAAANNQAMEEARSRYVMLLNPDTIVHPGALDGLVRFMDAHSEAWVAGPRLLNGNGSVQHSSFRFPSTWDILCESLFFDRLFPFSRVFGRHKEIYRESPAARTVDYVRGACLIVRATVLKTIGGMDENFFMYFEEADWCYRVAMAGGKVFICPEPKVGHLGGDEIGHYDERRLVHYHESLLFFYKKHRTSLHSGALRCVLALRSVVRIVAWSLAGVVRPGLRAAALSSLRGYGRVLGLVTGIRTRAASR